MENLLYIIWGKGNELGIPIIDEQHRALVSTINSLHYFIQQGEGDEVLNPTLQMLVQYTHIHFKTEESLMKEYGYPGFEEHLLYHKHLLEKTKAVSLKSLPMTMR